MAHLEGADVVGNDINRLVARAIAGRVTVEHKDMSLESADANLDVGTTSSCIRTMPERSGRRDPTSRRAAVRGSEQSFK
jgi:hypothetical protein